MNKKMEGFLIVSASGILLVLGLFLLGAVTWLSVVIIGASGIVCYKGFSILFNADDPISDNPTPPKLKSHTDMFNFIPSCTPDQMTHEVDAFCREIEDELQYYRIPEKTDTHLIISGYAYSVFCCVSASFSPSVREKYNRAIVLGLQNFISASDDEFEYTFIQCQAMHQQYIDIAMRHIPIPFSFPSSSVVMKQSCNKIWSRILPQNVMNIGLLPLVCMDYLMNPENVNPPYPLSKSVLVVEGILSEKWYPNGADSALFDVLTSKLLYLASCGIIPFQI